MQLVHYANGSRECQETRNWYKLANDKIQNRERQTPTALAVLDALFCRFTELPRQFVPHQRSYQRRLSRYTRRLSRLCCQFLSLSQLWSRSQFRFLKSLRRQSESSKRGRGPRPSHRPSRASWQFTNLSHFRLLQSPRWRPLQSPRLRPRPLRSPNAVTGTIIVSNRATMVIERKFPFRLDFCIQAPPSFYADMARIPFRYIN
jgi:hypothetical protein